MKKWIRYALGIGLICSYSFGNAENYLITRFGAKGDGKTDNTETINRTIRICSRKGGGTVVIPAGTFLSGTIRLESFVCLYLEKGAVIKGIDELEKYQSVLQDNKEERYYMVKEENWNKALILGDKVHHISITGEGVIDGSHVIDEKGEEGMRGPHALFLSRSTDIEISGITIRQASNYACMSYDIKNADFKQLTIEEGWDGIHIRGGENIRITDCRFFTGDDAIAGGEWNRMSIRDCHLNSSCNGVRVIMPVQEVEIEGCFFQGPGKYPHRTFRERKRRNMLSGVIVQPGAWFAAPGKVENVYVRNCRFDQLDNPFLFTLNKGNEGGTLRLEHIEGTRLLRAAASVEAWSTAGFRTVELSDISLEYVCLEDTALIKKTIFPAATDYRPLPVWGLYLRNIQNAVLRNIRLSSTDKEIHPAFGFDQVKTLRMEGIKTKESTEENESPEKF